MSNLYRNIEYLKENFKIMWKLTIEYKINFIINIIQMSIFMTIHIFGLYIIYFSLNDAVGWRFEDYLLFYFFSFLGAHIAGMFTYGKELSNFIIKGDLNVILTKPFHPFNFYTFSILSGWAFLSFFVRSIGFIFTILYFNIKVHNIFWIICFIALLNILFYITYAFIESFEFKFKKSSDSIYGIYNNVYQINNTYPAPLFGGFKYKNMMLLIPSYIVGLIILPLIRGNNINLFFNEILIIIGIILFLLFFTVLNWYNGLKKYEAYG